MDQIIEDYDVAIIGGGTSGLAATYYCAAAGYKTANFERFDYYNDYGSSDGYSRMFRVLYSEADMARMTETSLGLWTEIEQHAQAHIPDFDGELLKTNGLLFYGESHPSVEGDLQMAEEVMRKLGIPFNRYDATEMKKSFDMFREVPDSYFGLTQASGATIEVQKSLRLFHDMSKAHGASMNANTPVRIRKTSPGAPDFILETDKGLIRAKHLVIAAGAWTNQVVEPLGIQFNLTIWQMTLAYFKVNPALNWQMWYEFGKTDSDLYYGFPPLEYPDMIKVSVDWTNTKFKDPRDATNEPSQAILEDLSDFVSKRFTGIDATPYHPATCLYTMSTDNQIIMDNLPGYDNVSILTGESGRGFKFTPLIGRVLRELAMNGDTSYDIAPFRIKGRDVLSHSDENETFPTDQKYVHKSVLRTQ